MSSIEYESLFALQVVQRIIRYLGFLLLFILIFQNALSILIFQALTMVDEAMIMLVLLLLLVKILARTKIPTNEFFVISLFIYILLISIFFGKQQDYSKILMQSLTHIKFFLLFFFIEWIYGNNRSSLLSLKHFATAVFIISLVGLLLNLIFPDAFIEKFGIKFGMLSGERAGMIRLNGFQLLSNNLGFLLSLTYAYLVFKNILKFGFLSLAFLTLSFFALIILTGSRTALCIFPIVFFWLSYSSRSYRLWVAAGSIAILFIIFAFLGDTLFLMFDTSMQDILQFSNIENSKYIRGIMIYYGVFLFIDYFPIGSGAATFGSLLSGNSPIYKDLNVVTTYFFEEMQGIFDSNLATIMGEFGFIGFIMYSLGLFLFYKRSVRFSLPKGLRSTYCKCIVSFGLFVSITNPLFVSAYNGTIFSIALILAPLITEASKENKLV